MACFNFLYFSIDGFGRWMDHLGVQELLALFDGGGAQGRFRPRLLILLGFLSQSCNWRVILCSHFLHLTARSALRQVLACIVLLLLIDHLEVFYFIFEALNFTHLFRRRWLAADHCRVRIEGGGRFRLEKQRWHSRHAVRVLRLQERLRVLGHVRLALVHMLKIAAKLLHILRFLTSPILHSLV